MQFVDMQTGAPELSVALGKCLKFAQEQPLDTLAAGRYEIDGDTVYAAVSEYETKPAGQKKWEAHREYVDLQLLVSGEEEILVSPLSNMTLGEYTAHKDFLACDGLAAGAVLMKPGTGLLLFPEDAHKPGVGNGVPVKKVVFKIRVSAMVDG